MCASTAALAAARHGWTPTRVGPSTGRGGRRCHFRSGHGVVPANSRHRSGELVEAAAPGSEAGAEDAERVAGAAERVAAVVVGAVGVVVDGPEQPGGAGAGVPPGPQQGPGAPQRHPGYPAAGLGPDVRAGSRVAAVRSGADWGTPNSGQSGAAGVVGSSRLPFKGLFSTIDTGRSPLSSTAGVSCADSSGSGSGSAVRGVEGVGCW